MRGALVKPTPERIDCASESTFDVCCDVGMTDLHLTAGRAGASRFPRVFSIANRTEPIRAALAEIRTIADGAGLARVRVVVEPTGVYHKLLLRLSREAGFEPCLVNAEHVVKMRQVLFGDDGKTDRRDPQAIAAVAAQDRLIVDRQLPETYELLRGWGGLYQNAEDAIIEVKNRVHSIVKSLFPDFDFGVDFLYGPSGSAIVKLFGLNPHRIAALSPSRLQKRLRGHCRILAGSVRRLSGQARISATSTPAGARNALAEETLRLAFEELDLHRRRREVARDHLESLYATACAEDPRLPRPTKGVVSATMLARLVAESGPLGDFASWRQLLRLAGLNLRERQSGKYRGLTKIARKGRPQLRRILNIMALPLVRSGHLFGDWYAQKTDLQKMPGKKAMTAVSRKLVKMIWGWYHSEAVFDPQRVFRCESDYRKAA